MSDGHEALPQGKAALLERIHAARQELEQLLAGLSDDQKRAPGPAGGWSVQDHLVHLSAWETSIPALLQHQPRYAAMGLDAATVERADEGEINELIYQRHKHDTLAEVMSAFQRGHQAMLEVLATLSDDDLRRPYSYYQPDEPGEDGAAPIMAWIAGNTYDHYREHAGWLRTLVAQQP